MTEPVQPQPDRQPLQQSQEAEVYPTFFRASIGPIPDPSILHAYEDIYPGAAKHFFDAWQQEQNHRHQNETRLVDAQIDDLKSNRDIKRRGQTFGLVVALTAIFCGSFVAASGREIAGSVIGGGSVVALVSLFIIGDRSKSNDVENSAKNTPQDTLE